jgi:hypothetical protein
MCSTLESAGTASLFDDNAGVDKSVGEAPLMLHDMLKQRSVTQSMTPQNTDPSKLY